MRIVFTGGSGKAGKYVLQHLVALGHRVLNLDLVASDVDGVCDLAVDLTDAGQVFSAMTGIAGFDELDQEEDSIKVDAIVHFAAVPRIQLRSDTECFRINTVSTYNVLEAALKLGIKKVLLASSETTYGVCFAHGEIKPDYIPVDELHPAVPHDAYAMSKVCNEVCGHSFHKRSGGDIYALRINNVIEPHDYAEMTDQWRSDPECRRRNIFGYIDTRDLSVFVERALLVDGLGFQIFNVANPDTSVGPSNPQLISQFYEGVPLRRELAEHETFYSIEKAKQLLGFDPPSRWRDA